jgi:hypothetical protein
MEALKSFDEFDTEKAKSVEQTPTKKVEEQLFKRKNKAKGKDVWREGGKRHVVKYKSQDDKNFIVKIINDKDILDANHNITKSGEDALLNHLNNEKAFVNLYGIMHNAYFTDKIIAYTVKRDTDRKQKIQFTIINRADLPEGLNIPATARFIPASILKGGDLNDILVNQEEVIVNPLPVDPIDPISKDCPEGQEWDEETQACVIIDEKIPGPIVCGQPGKRFNYQSGEDGKMYIVIISADGTFVATDGYGVHEYKIYPSKLDASVIMWENENGLVKEIVNAKDKEFFTKAFSDDDYICELIRNFDPGESLNFRDVLYHKSNGERIFGDTMVKAKAENIV